MALYAEALERFRLEIDSLNVFPVPDGDTGTNLLHTQRAVLEALSRDGAATGGGGVAVASLPALRETIPDASLAGARGNSGVILSQVLRALCAALPDEGADGAGVARALRDAAAEARRAVAEPKEGTVLTVLDGAARAASGAGPGAGVVLDAALRAARAALGRTQSLLPELRAAGVVDAGGKGAVLLLDALHAAVTGGDLTEPTGMAGPVGAEAGEGTRSLRGDLAPAYEVQFLIEAPGDEGLAELRSRLAVLGDSLAVVGGSVLYRVHVHTDRPEDVLAAARATAEPRYPSVERLTAQVAECLGGSAREVRAGRTTCGLVALAEGPGLAEALRSLGANVVAGGSGRGARTDTVAAAVASVRADGVVVLCTQTDADAARRSLGLETGSDRALVVVAAYPAAISAAAAFHPDATIATNVAAMTAAAERCRAGEVTARGDEAASAVTQLVVRLGAGVTEAEVVTLVVGDAVPGEEVATVAAALRRGFPRLRVEVIAGGQRTRYLVGLE